MCAFQKVFEGMKQVHGTARTLPRAAGLALCKSHTTNTAQGIPPVMFSTKSENALLFTLLCLSSPLCKAQQRTLFTGHCCGTYSLNFPLGRKGSHSGWRLTTSQEGVWKEAKIPLRSDRGSNSDFP